MGDRERIGALLLERHGIEVEPRSWRRNGRLAIEAGGGVVLCYGRDRSGGVVDLVLYHGCRELLRGGVDGLAPVHDGSYRVIGYSVHSNTLDGECADLVTGEVPCGFHVEHD